MFIKFLSKAVDFLLGPMRPVGVQDISRRIERVALDDQLIGTVVAWAIVLYNNHRTLVCVPISSRDSTRYSPLGLEFRMLENGGKYLFVIESPTMGYRSHMGDWFSHRDEQGAVLASIFIIDHEPDAEELRLLGDVIASGFRGVGP